VADLLKAVQEKISQAKQKERNLYAGMFGKVSQQPAHIYLTLDCRRTRRTTRKARNRKLQCQPLQTATLPLHTAMPRPRARAITLPGPSSLPRCRLTMINRRRPPTDRSRVPASVLA
jgi:hypothetical protein